MDRLKRISTAGIPKMTFATIVDDSKSQEKINEFKERKAKSDADLAQKAHGSDPKAKRKKTRESCRRRPSRLMVRFVIGRKIADDIPVRKWLITSSRTVSGCQGYILTVKFAIALRTQADFESYGLVHHSLSRSFSRMKTDDSLV